jgi:hypothetical protein
MQRSTRKAWRMSMRRGRVELRAGLWSLVFAEMCFLVSRVGDY